MHLPPPPHKCNAIIFFEGGGVMISDISSSNDFNFYIGVNNNCSLTVFSLSLDLVFSHLEF